MRVSAPGKLVLAGEYAVADGGPGVVLAVDRRAALERVPGAVDAPLVAAARHAAARALGIDLPPGGFVADTIAFRHLSRKLGLGSSASVTVAAVATVFADAGLDPADPAVRERMWAPAKEAHDAFQAERGSGIDLAASLSGGAVVLRRGGASNGHPTVRPTLVPWTPPAGLRWVALWTGAEAFTPALLASVRQFQARDPAGWAAFRRAMDEVTERLAGEGSRDAAAAVEALRLQGALMEGLGHAAGVDIVTPAMVRLAVVARTAGGGAKPSGAGGGDCVIAAFPPDGDPAWFLGEAARLGFTALDLSLDPAGVHVEDL
jgi:phosphomevalonate kinase